MRFFLLALLIAVAVSGCATDPAKTSREPAGECVVVIDETFPEDKPNLASFLLRDDEPHVAPTSGVAHADLPASERYKLKEGGELWIGGKKVCDTPEIAAQAEMPDGDILIVRRWHNSFTSPIKLLMAFSGHPAQPEELWAMRVKGESVVWSEPFFLSDDGMHMDAGKRYTARICRTLP
ncbi:MAG TPA: hypothetical protein VFJ90_05015, partial [Candidatus Didemnitutus sp.]|nr:hypothetical protein [Candidatus Didemnitutus sp.]